MNKPTLFIGSSREGIEFARALQTSLEPDTKTILWSNQVFSLGEYSLDSLLKTLDTVDFAVVVLTSDDFVSGQYRSETSPRDNVVFELGLFMGRLGRSRVLVVMAEDAPIRLPSDLAGVMVARFRRRADGNVLAALAPASHHIREQINAISHKEKSARSSTPVDHYSCFISYSAQDKAFVERIYADLQDVGIRCWLDVKDLKIGEEVGVQIDQAVQLTDTWIMHTISVPSVGQTRLAPPVID